MSKQVNWLKRLQLLLKALEKNGVKTDVWVELEPKISGYELDFSEHDKVFEDKYNTLKEEYDQKCKDYKSVSSLLSTYQQENESLKQRIAELESKETEKPKNGWICVVAKEINGQEYVKLEDFLRVVNDLQEQNRLEDDGK